VANNSGFTLQTKRKVGAAMSTKRRIGAAVVAEAIGADDAMQLPGGADTPLGFFAVRQKLIHGLRSTGGRPGFENVERRKIPVTGPVWRIVAQAAEAMAEPGFHPTPSQVASALLSLAVRSMAPNLVHEVQHALNASRAFGDSPRVRKQATG
jgi:hypothetical protein